MTHDDEICCPRLDKTLWDEEMFEWKDMPFIKGKVRTLFYMPLNIGKVMEDLTSRASAAGVEFVDMLALSDHTSLWNIDVYLAVSAPVKGAENTTISGKYHCRIFEGDYGMTGKWTSEVRSEFSAKGWKQGRMFMWYATCPKCAKKYGANTVGIFTEVLE